MVESIIMNDASAIEKIDPMVLSSRYSSTFSSVKDNEDYAGYHKMLHTGPILRDSIHGVVKDAERKARSDCCAVNRFKTEHICQYIADGRGVVGAFKAGPKLEELKFGQVYFPPSDSTEHHAVVFIGAIIGLGRIIYIFLNSWGREFCAFRDENGNFIMGGVGLVETLPSCNPIVLSRSWEKGASGRLFVSWKVNMTAQGVSEEVDQLLCPHGRPTFVNRKVWKSDDLSPFVVAKDDSHDTSDDEPDIFDRLMHGQTNVPKVEYTPWSLLHGHKCVQHQPVRISSFNGRECEHNAMPMSKLDFNTEEDCTKQGIAIHHSGLLPIIKEMVELFCQEGLVKAIFATETVEGVNRVARPKCFFYSSNIWVGG